MRVSSLENARPFVDSRRVRPVPQREAAEVGANLRGRILEKGTYFRVTVSCPVPAVFIPSCLTSTHHALAQCPT